MEPAAVASSEAFAGVTAVTASRFEEFFDAEHVRLARALYLLTGSAAEADELTQEAMVRVYERWDRVQRMDSRQGYLFRTALNLHRSRVRWQATRMASTSGRAVAPMSSRLESADRTMGRTVGTNRPSSQDPSPTLSGASRIQATSGAITALASSLTPRSVFEAYERWSSRPT